MNAQMEPYKKFSIEILGGRTMFVNKNMRSTDIDNPKAGFTKIGRNIEMALGYYINKNSMLRLQGNIAFSRSNWAEARLDEVLDFFNAEIRPLEINYSTNYNIGQIVISFRKENELKPRSKHQYFWGVGGGINFSSTPYNYGYYMFDIGPSGFLQTQYTVYSNDISFSPVLNLDTGLKIDLGRQIYFIPQLQFWTFHQYNKPLFGFNGITQQISELPLTPIGGIKVISALSLGLRLSF